jgi:PAS domain S-box-containing protein
MRFPPPLHILVLLIVLSLSTVTLAIKALILDRVPMQRYLESQTIAANVQVQRLLTAASRSATERRALANQIGVMRVFPTLRWAAVCDREGKVLACTLSGWEGRPLAESAPPEAVLLFQKAASSRKPLQDLRGTKDMLAAHAAPPDIEQPLEFVALEERDLSTGADKVRATSRQDLQLSGAMLLTFSLLSWATVYFFVKWRMNEFYDKLGLGGGKIDSLIPLPGSDEFADISRVLGSAEHLLRDAADNLQEIVWVVAPDMRPIYVSPSFERVYLLPRQAVFEKPGSIPDHILKEYHERVSSAFQAVRRGAQSLQVEFRVRRGDGQIRWIEARGTAIRDSTGALLRIVGTSRDVTAQKSLQEDLVNVSEQERHSLGHDLHDDACQRLAAIKLKSEALATQLKLENSTCAGLASEITGQLGGASTLLKNMARGLAPVAVEEDGLMHALEKLAQMQESIHEVPCFFSAAGTVNVRNRIVASHVYRIVQEFMTNAARHAHPRRIDVRIETAGEAIRLTVTNDGLPFRDPPVGHTGMGLKILRYRASAIGAEIEVRPRTDGVPGTVAECSVPLEVCQLAGANVGQHPPPEARSMPAAERSF